MPSLSLEITLLMLNGCYYSSENLNELNTMGGSIFSSFLHQNNLTKAIAQINDYLFIYMKFKAMDHALQHVAHFVRRKKGSFVHVAYCITDHFRVLP